MSSVRRLRVRKEKRAAKAKLLFVIVMLAVTLFCITVYAFGDKEEVSYREVVVKEGDTLWDIAAFYAPASMDVRRAVYDIEKASNISAGYINVGDVLLVPIYY